MYSPHTAADRDAGAAVAGAAPANAGCGISSWRLKVGVTATRSGRFRSARAGTFDTLEEARAAQAAALTDWLTKKALAK